MLDMGRICADLQAEQDDLDHLLTGLSEADWDCQTPAVGWSIRDQVIHLGTTDRVATMAAGEPGPFHCRDSAPGPRGAHGASAGNRPQYAWPGLVSLVAHWTARHAGRVSAARSEDTHPLVWSGHERSLLCHRPPHGNLGARTGHCRHPGGAAPGHRAFAACGAYRCARSSIQLHSARPHPAGRGGAG